MFHRRQNVPPVVVAESVRNARVEQHPVNDVAELCGRLVAPVEAAAGRPARAVGEAAWMPRMALPADIAVVPVGIPASSVVAAAVSHAASARARV